MRDEIGRLGGLGQALRAWFGDDADVGTVGDLVRARMFGDDQAMGRALAALTLDEASMLSALKIFTLLSALLAFRIGRESGHIQPAAHSVGCVNQAEAAIRAMLLET